MKKCQDVARELATSGPHRSKPWQDPGLHLHLMLCRRCRRYAAQLRAVDRVAREMLGATGSEGIVGDRLRARFRRAAGRRR